MMIRIQIIFVSLLFREATFHVLSQNQTWPSRVLPGQLGFPGTSDFFRLGSLLSGSTLSPHDVKYGNASLMWNIRVTKSPFFIVYPRTIEDIQRCILFAREFNMHTSIRSSGHSFIGRSTFDGSLNVNLALMKKIDVNLKSARNPAGEVTVQSGASWIEVYGRINQTMGPDKSGQGQVGRVIVGGSAHTVAMGGYTQGGGHSPISRKFGLAVDNLLEATLVTADGYVVTVSLNGTVTRYLNGTTAHSTDTSLFWAIRGGGGGTWGIVVSFTYKIHYAPKRIRKVTLIYPLFAADGSRIYKSDVTTALSGVNNLSEDWGGYIITSGAPVAYTTYRGSIVFSLLHCGDDISPSNKEVDAIIKSTHPIYKEDKKYATFMDYEAEPKDGVNGNAYVINTFVKKSSLSNSTSLNSLADFIYTYANRDQGCTLTLIGGNATQSKGLPPTPIHPGFRSGVFSASCGASWKFNPLEDETHANKALDMALDLYPFGDGSYFNEPAEDMPDWKKRFWNDHATYNRLLQIKKTYDQDNYFWCHNCVGSDLGYQYGPATSEGTPGQPVHKFGNFDYTRVLGHSTAKYPIFPAPIIG